MPSSARCGRCGAPLAAFATEGFCSACMLEVALESTPVSADTDRPVPLQHFGDYELLEEIARGGMGVVFRARQISLGRVVALKMILSGRLASEIEIRRFHDEARAAAALRHPNIVAIHEVGEIDGQPYFSMDFVEGRNLAEAVREGPFTPGHAAACVHTVAEAIHYAHEHGILHRDLKPSNVLLDAEGLPHVTDFGLAKQLSNTECETRSAELTVSGQVLGSPNFMPPEQAAGRHRELTPAADVYSLGALLYHLLTGRPPFLADSVPATLRLVAETEPVAPKLLNPGIPRDLETICLKCLDKDPHRRYGTAQALAEELARFLRDEPIQARPAGRWEKFHRWMRRHPVIAMMMGVIGVLLIAVAVISTMAATRLQRANREGQEKLREAYLSQARANRWSGRPGRRFDSLDIIAKAAAIRTGRDLRDEAIAAMALVDLRPVRTWDVPSGITMNFDPRYEQYARSDTNGSISVHRVRDDSEITRFSGFGIQAHGFAFSPEGRFLAAHYRSDPSTYAFKVYDLKNSGKVRLDVPNRWVRVSPFSPDGKLLAMSWSTKNAGRLLTLYDLETCRELNSFPTDNLPYGLAFAPHGRQIAIGSAESMHVYIHSVPDGQKLETLVHPNGTYGLSWDANGRRLAVASADGNIYLWDFSSAPPSLTILPHQSFAMSAVFHPRDDLLMSFGWDHVARLWNPDTGKELLRLPADWIGPFSEDGRWIKINSGSRTVGLFEVASADECRPYYFSGTDRGARRVVHGPGGRWLVSGHRDGLRLTDVTTGFGRHFADLGDTHELQFTRNGQALVTAGDRGVQWWPVRPREEDGKMRVEVGPPTPLSREPPGSVDPANRMLAVANSKAYIFDSKSFRIERRLTTQQEIYEGCLSPDGRHCATVSRGSGALYVWDAADGRQLAKLEPPSQQCVKFSPDGRWLVSGASDEYRFWETGSWTLNKTLPRGVTGAAIGEIAFTPDSTIVALAIGRGEVGLYDASTLELLATLETPETLPASDLEFSPDGAHLVVSVTAPYVYRRDLRLLRHGLAELKLDFDRPPLPARASPTNSLELVVIGSVGDRPKPAQQPSDFPPRDVRCTANQIDLTRFYNAALTNSWLNPQGTRNDLAALSFGLQMRGETEFDIRGIVQLSCSHPDLKIPFPTEVREIPVGQRCRALNFLHACAWLPRAVGADIGEYVIRYSDESERSVPLVFGENIANIWENHNASMGLKPGTRIAWRGRSPLSEANGTDMLLFHFRWENARPEVTIASITFRSRMTSCAPFLVALTAE